MKLTVTRKELHDALQVVSRVVSTQSTLPVLRNVLIEPVEGHVRFSATDLELGVEVLIPARIHEPGVITVPARTLLEIVSGLPEADVSLGSDDQHHLILSCRRSDYRINGLGSDDFPPLPEVGGHVSLTLAQPVMKEMIRQTALAVSTDDTRPILTGVCLVVMPDRLRLVATDTHRLALRTSQVPQAHGETTVIVPVRALNELSRVLSDDPQDTLDIRVDQNQVLFKTDRIVLVSRLIEGQFPRFERVIPDGYTRRLALQRDELLSALRRARIFARDGSAKDRVIFETVGDSLVITAETGDLGNAREEISVEREGEETRIAFNVSYLLDVLGVLSSEGVHVEMTEPLNASVIRPIDGEDYLMVVMPMQLQ